MFILILFAFIAGIVTILSPCILPVLPIVLSGATVENKKYPLGVVTGFVASFAFFTLFLSTLVSLTGISANLLRSLSIIIILLFGLVLAVPKLNAYFEVLAFKLQPKKTTSTRNRNGFGAGFLIGISLGLIWTPCVGPILASVIALALSGTVTGSAVLITLSYALGTAIPMLGVMYGGRKLLNRVPWLFQNLGKIQKVFGVLLIGVAIAMTFNLDRRFQTYILQKFPNYGSGLVNFEQNQKVADALEKTFNENGNEDIIGKPMPDRTETQYKPAPELVGTGEWFNSKALSLQSLHGKVVLIDFWTYSCINCIRTLPYIQRWNEKYENKGLVIIGVHTPEFEFEKDAGNLQKAINDFGLTYPIVQDNDYKTWRAYKNSYWPAKYFIDAQGRIRDTHFGEGSYDKSEKFIQKLLTEAGASISEAEVKNPEYKVYSQTPELYLGYGRISNLISVEKLKKDDFVAYSAPQKIGNDQFAYSGNWKVEEEKAWPQKGAELTLNFGAKDVFLVMNNLNGKTGKAEVYLDGEKISNLSGEDVKDGMITIDQDRLYHLINLKEPGRHLLRLKFKDDNTEVYAFTFG